MSALTHVDTTHKLQYSISFLEYAGLLVLRFI